MERINVAVLRFKQGFSCSQAVLSAFSDAFLLDMDTALRISQPFGGGIAHKGEICGAVSGALMVIGLKHGRIKAEDIQAKEKTYEVVREFIKRFNALHGTTNCKELLGYDLDTKEGLMCAKEKKLFETVCPKFVQTAAEIIEKIIDIPS